MSLVLDASVTLAWIYPDETTDAIREVFDVVASDGAVVPATWLDNELRAAARAVGVELLGTAA